MITRRRLHIGHWRGFVAHDAPIMRNCIMAENTSPRRAYAVTKAGLSHLTRVLALEWAPHKINVNAIAPAPTITDLNRKYFEDHPEDLRARVQSIPLGRLGTPQDYVGVAVFLASRASDFVTGQTYFVDGGSNLI